MTDKEIHKICKKYSIENYTIEDGLVNVDGSVYLSNKGLEKIPLKFGKVRYYFYCSHNKLKNLLGSPTEVGGSFYCNGNNLVSLEGAPKKVGFDFYCHDNKLSSLDNAPLKIVNKIYCGRNKRELSYEKYLLKKERLNKLKQLND